MIISILGLKLQMFRQKRNPESSIQKIRDDSCFMEKIHAGLNRLNDIVLGDNM